MSHFPYSVNYRVEALGPVFQNGVRPGVNLNLTRLRLSMQLNLKLRFSKQRRD